MLLYTPTVVASFESQLTSFSKRLRTNLCKLPPHPRKPRFYGIHKQFTRLPPIVSQSSSLLTPSAKFVDHVLQPIASSYPDYLKNSTTLAITLQNLHVPDDAFLVTVDVSKLYPSIPQTECLAIIYEQLHTHRHLLTFDPNLIIKLLHVNVNNNYFSFGHATFQQIRGTAMGAPFSPSMANIFMSITIAKFLETQDIQPHFLTRYIDDILIIWTGTLEQLTQFLINLNNFHPSLHYTSQQSTSSIDFLDLTIYKGPAFHFTNILDTQTFQTKLNLYQYLHFTSNHPKNVFKKVNASDTSGQTATVFVFKKRLLKRGYPQSFIDKATASVKYESRQSYLEQKDPQPKLPKPPIYRFLPPPQYHLLILQGYAAIHFMTPRFIPLRHPTLHNKLVRAQIKLTDEQLVDLVLRLDSTVPAMNNTATCLPELRSTTVSITKCNHPRCATCQVHLNCSPMFKSNYPLTYVTPFPVVLRMSYT